MSGTRVEANTFEVPAVTSKGEGGTSKGEGNNFEGGGGTSKVGTGTLEVGLSTSQGLSLIVAAGSIVFMVMRLRKIRSAEKDSTSA